MTLSNRDQMRFWTKVDRPRAQSCWEWQFSLDRDGYGHFGLGGTMVKAHRLAYELLVGPIPPNLVIDHLCENPACCNPYHMEPVPQSVNVLRGKSLPAQNALKTHCKRGHPYDGENLYTDSDGARHCRACRRLSDIRRRPRKRKAAA